jgi:hypothetical protein
MKLPLSKGRFGALKKLLVYVGTLKAATRQESWSELAGVQTQIEQAKGRSAVAMKVELSATQATHVRIRLQPTDAGKEGVWGLTLDDAEEGDVSITKTSAQTVTLIGLACGCGADLKPHLTRVVKLLCAAAPPCSRRSSTVPADQPAAHAPRGLRAGLPSARTSTSSRRIGRRPAATRSLAWRSTTRREATRSCATRR